MVLKNGPELIYRVLHSLHNYILVLLPLLYTTPRYYLLYLIPTLSPADPTYISIG